MPARTNTVSVPGLPPVPTPAPLLLTRRGQLPYLPSELLHLAVPPGHAPLLLQLPLLDWHTLNPNTPLHGADLFSALENRASTLADASDGQFRSTYTQGAAGYCAQRNAVLFLCNRAAGSDEMISNTAGKSTCMTGTSGSRRDRVSPADAVRLHKALGTHFLTSGSDGPRLPCGSGRSARRRWERSQKQLAEGLEAGGRGLLASVQGADMVAERVEAARAAVGRAREVDGYSIDGLYAGEAAETRWRCVAAAVGELPERGVRVLGGGHGAAAEVLAAVRCGVDVVESVYPFEQAAAGMATDVRRGGRVNCRDRRGMREKGGLVEGCGCGVCTRFSRGYVRHLLEVHEMMGVSLLAAHNLWDYLQWFERIRQAVREGGIGKVESEWERGRAMRRAGAEADK